jgi:hypothetical protein
VDIGITPGAIASDSVPVGRSGYGPRPLPTRVCRPWRRHVAVLPVVVVTTQRPAPVEAPGVSGRDRVGLGFVVLYALAFMASCLMLIAPLLVTLGALGEVVFHAA